MCVSDLVFSFLFEHPGGEEILVEWGGKDATKEFDSIGHSAQAKQDLLKYAIGTFKTGK